MLLWMFRENFFDFVYMRYLFGLILDWDVIFEQVYVVMKLGGWIESFEVDVNLYLEDGMVMEDLLMGMWIKVFKEVKKKFGRMFFFIEEDVQRRGIEKVGFVNIIVKDIKVSFVQEVYGGCRLILMVIGVDDGIFEGFEVEGDWVVQLFGY